MEFINGAWRATSANEGEPKEANLTGVINAGCAATGNLDISGWSTNTTTANYCNYYWRWDGIRWVHEPEWVWIPPDSYWQYPETSTYWVLVWKGKTILYRVMNSYIEYLILHKTTTTNLEFKATANLEEILKGLE